MSTPAIVSILYLSVLSFFVSVLVDHSTCNHHFSPRASLSHYPGSNHRQIRRAYPASQSPSLRRRSFSPDNHFSPDPFDDNFTLDTKPSRRSITFDRFDDDNDDFDDISTQAFQKAQDDAQSLWERYVAPIEGEDPDSYSDCEDDDEEEDLDQNSSSSNGSAPQTSSSVSSQSKDDHNKASHSSSDLASITAGKNNDHSDSPQPQSDQDDSSDQQPEESNPSPQSTHQQKDDTKKHSQDQQPKKSNDQAQTKQHKQDAQDSHDNESGEAPDQQQTQSAVQAPAGNDKYASAQADKDKQAAAQAEKDKQAAAQADKDKQAAAQAEKDKEAAQAKKDAEAKKSEAGKQDSDLPTTQTTPAKPVTPAKPKDDNDSYGSSSPSSEEHTGDATYYDPGLGSCGDTNSSTDYIVAVSHLLYDSFPSQDGNPNTNQICGKKIRATYQGRWVIVTVKDRCVGCEMYALDFTITAFEKLGNQDQGRLHGMTWTFI